MSSVNPFIVLPEALYSRGQEIAKGLFGSFTLGVGQFCTKPGLVFLPENAEADALVAELKTHVEKAPCAPLLTEGIAKSYHAGVAERVGKANVETVVVAAKPADIKQTYAIPVVFQIKGSEFLADHSLAGEIFGPTTVVIRYKDNKELVQLVSALHGQLTATLHGTEGDIAAFGDLIAALERKAGRLVLNGFPTGVEVCHAMVHGGPYPATADSRFTSVGTMAIYRFARPVCFQDFPQAALPEELKDGNPLGIMRLVNGVQTRDTVGAKG
jgi:NADP-dependent aldehyde dehydrogenase